MDDLISEFITETSESLQQIDSELVKLEQDPNNAQILSSIFRLVHTIKGTCGFLGLPRLESVAHAGENVLGKIRDKVIVVTPDAISLVLESIDCIKLIIDYLGSNEEEPAGDDVDLIARLNAFADSNGQSSAAAAPPSPPAATTAVATLPSEADIARKAKETAILEGLNADVKEQEENAGSVGAGQTIRVSLDVLENLMQMVSELVLTRNQLLQIVRTRSDPVLATPLQHLSHITSELQEGIMKTRMQPIGNAWAKFPRLMRDLSRELGKRIDLRMKGAETELDRQLLEMIKDPLTHMVRNSADHGLELPADRHAAGKPETGVITLSAFHEGGQIIIEIQDDGRGLNIERIRQKAVAGGLVMASAVESLSDRDVMQFIFRPGFSTAEKVTSVSGRGVGMDVVRTNIERIGGTVELASTPGRGSKFTVKIPLTLAIVSVLIVAAAGERFALPQINVQELVRVGSDTGYRIERINQAPVLRLRDTLLPMISLAAVLGLPASGRPSETTLVAVCRVGAYRFGLIVDRVFDTEEIVVKPISTLLRHIPLYSGNTILGDGSVIMILDPNGLVRTTGEHDLTTERESAVDPAQEAERQPISFLLFKAGADSPKAVPLELVSRLEEIDMANVELAGGHPVMQYRGDLMRLRCLDEATPVPRSDIYDIVVFNYNNKTLGLVVDDIIDIIPAVYDMKLSSDRKGLLGSMIIEGKATDVVDVASLLRDILQEDDIDEALLKASRPARLLLVEDSPFFRSLTEPFLTTAGYRVTTAASAREALALLESQAAFDVIVSDIEMPGMDGYAFAELCHNHPKLEHIPLFAFTATKNPRAMERGLQAGFKDFILKTDRAGLLKAIAAKLGRHSEKESV